jgi:hypothetical protein
MVTSKKLNKQPLALARWSFGSMKKLTLERTTYLARRG